MCIWIFLSRVIWKTINPEIHHVPSLPLVSRSWWWWWCTATELLIAAAGVYHRSTYIISNVASYQTDWTGRRLLSSFLYYFQPTPGFRYFVRNEPKEEVERISRWDDRGPSILIDRPTLRHWRIRHYTFSIPVVNQKLTGRDRCWVIRASI